MVDFVVKNIRCRCHDRIELFVPHKRDGDVSFSQIGHYQREQTIMRGLAQWWGYLSECGGEIVERCPDNNLIVVGSHVEDCGRSRRGWGGLQRWWNLRSQ